MKPKKVVILVEEPSMTKLLTHLLPKLNLDCEWQIITHEGKTDLEKSAPRKLKAWNDPYVDLRFVVMRDNDGGDCRSIKRRIIESCAGTDHIFLVRIVMQELESWLLSDFCAIDTAYPYRGIASQARKAKFRNPDALTNASEIVEKLTGDRGKISRANKIGQFMNLDCVTSRSLGVFLEGLRRLAT